MRNSRNIAVTLLTAFLLALMLGTVGTSVQADGVSRNTSGGGEDKESNEEKKQEDQKEEGEPANKNDNCGTKGGPVSLFDGKERAQRTDLVVNGLFPIRISRQYDSQSKYDSQLGYGWSLNHDRRLYQYPDGSVVIRYGCGSRDRFVYTGGAYVTPSQGRQGMLTENPDGSFVYRRRYGTTEYYDPEGRITALQNKYGHRHEYTYDPAGKFPLTGTSPYAIDPSTPMTVAYQYRLTRIDERAADGVLTGNFVTLAYSGTTGRLTTVTASDGRTVGYVHDTTGGLTRGNLEQVNGLESIVATHRYEDPNDFHNLTYVRNVQNATPWVNTYDSLDRVIQQTYGNDTLAFDYVVDYTETTVTHTVTDAAGLNPYDIVTTWEFDANGDVALMRDHEGNESVFVRDIRGDLVSRKYYENQGTLAVPVLVLQREIEFTYDLQGRRLTRTITLDDGEVITHSWTWDNDWLASEQRVSSDDPGKIFRTEYDFHRDGSNIPTAISQVRRRKDDGSFQATALVYDAKNRLQEVTLPDGQKMVNVYEGGSLFLTKQYFEIGAAESPNRRSRFTYDAHGNRNSVRDAHDNLTQLTYDDLGRVTSATNPSGEETHVTFAGYRRTHTEVGRTVADGEGRVLRFNFTPQGWVSLVEEKDGGGNWHAVGSYTYDSAGQQLTDSDALNRTDTYAYNGFGQVVSMTDPLNNTMLFAYDIFGNQVSATDAEGRVSLVTYDDLDRIVSIEQLGVNPSAKSLYTHDANSNLVSMTDAEGKQTLFTYDTLSRLTGLQKPLGQTVQYYYDARNRIDYKVNARGQKVDYGYEDWGPLSTVEWYATETAPTPLRTITHGLDAQGNVTSLTDDSVQPGALYTYTYDVLNRPDVTTVHYIPGGPRTLDDGFDRLGHRDSLTFTDGAVFQHDWTYDIHGRLSASTLPGSQSYSFSYYDSGQLQQLVSQNGVTTANVFRNNGPLESITFTGTGGQIEQLAYTYDDVLNVDTMADVDGLHDYTYDGLDRLTDAAYPAPAGLANESWVYDRVGNRDSAASPGTYAYDNNNRITQGPAYNYTFDDDGNLTARSDGAVLGYDEENRLVSYANTGQAVSYVYDPLNRRISKTVNGVTTWYLWDDTDLLAEYDAAGVRTARYAYNPNDLTAAQYEDANGIYEVHKDAQQLPRLMTDSSQQVVWRARYSSFGLTTELGDVDGDSNVISFPQRFPGQYHDAETGFFYNLYRYYDPALGRYITSDPVRDGDNWFLYANGNSMAWVDPVGLASCGFWDRAKSAYGAAAAGVYMAGASAVEGAIMIGEAAYDVSDIYFRHTSVGGLPQRPDLSGQWKARLMDPLESAASVLVNRAFDRPDRDSAGSKVVNGYQGVVNHVNAGRGALNLWKYYKNPRTQGDMLKFFRQKDKANQSFKDVQRNIRNPLTSPAKARLWKLSEAEMEIRLGQEIYDIGESVVKAADDYSAAMHDPATGEAGRLTDGK